MYRFSSGTGVLLGVYMYLETNPGPIARTIRVKLFTHKPSKTNTN